MPMPYGAGAINNFNRPQYISPNGYFSNAMQPNSFYNTYNFHQIKSDSKLNNQVNLQQTAQMPVNVKLPQMPQMPLQEVLFIINFIQPVNVYPQRKNFDTYKNEMYKTIMDDYYNSAM